jgi:hypothetical protein
MQRLFYRQDKFAPARRERSALAESQDVVALLGNIVKLEATFANDFFQPGRFQFIPLRLAGFGEAVGGE